MEEAMATRSSTLARQIPWTEEPGGLQSMGSLRTGHDWATHSSVLAWRIPGTGEPGGLQSMGSHRVGHDWRDLAAAAAALQSSLCHVCVDGTFRGWTHLLVTSNQRWTKKFFQKLINVLSMLLWFWYSIKNTVEYIIWLWNVDHQMDSCKISGSGELNTY